VGGNDVENADGNREVDRVPRSEAEEAELLESGQDGWEYLLFAAVLRRRTADLEPRWREHEAGFRPPSQSKVSEREALDQLNSVFPESGAIVNRMMVYFSPEEQERAFGKLGESGNPDRIRDLSEGIVGGYAALLDWSARTRATGLPERFRAIFDLAGEFQDLPLRQYRAFVDEAVRSLDELPAGIREGRDLNVKLGLTLSIDPEVQKRFYEELARTEAQLKDDLAVDTTLAYSLVRAEAPREDTAIESSVSQPVASGGFFQKRRGRRAADKYQAELAAWQTERDACAENLALVKGFAGDAQSSALLLKRGELVFATVTGAALVEDRRGPGQWQGRSSGFSIPVGSIGGRSIRYRTGQSRGHFVQGAPAPTAIDTGNVIVTNRRVVFQGAKQTRECLFDKLVGFQHASDGSTVFSVSNRQKPTTVHYGPNLAGWFDLRLDLALAHYRNDLTGLVGQVEADLKAIDTQKPTPPLETA
jgi:hypothetical protein